jgi:predicted aspartyl protease
MSVIEWQHDGRRIVLPISILRPAPTDFTQFDALALVDTGATTSAIVKRIADQLELPPRGKRPMYIARGLTQVERYLFRIGFAAREGDRQPAFPFVFDATLGFELSDTTPLPDGRMLNAVLGMDVLSQCDLSIDRHGSCKLFFG